MNTGSMDERKMLSDISYIAHSLNRIADCMETAEKRARKYDEEYGKPKEAVDRAFEYMEASAAADTDPDRTKDLAGEPVASDFEGVQGVKPSDVRRYPDA